MSVPQIVIVRPVDLNAAQFAWDTASKSFKILPVSSDAANLLTKGADNLASLLAATIQANQVTYTAVLSGDSSSIVFSKVIGATSTTLSTIPITTTDMHVSSAALTNGNLVLTEADGATVTVSLASFLTAVTTANSTSLALTGAGTSASPLTAAITLDNLTGNLLKITASGTKVDPADVLSLLNVNISHSFQIDTTNGVLTSTVYGKTASLALVQLMGADGITIIGYAFTGSVAVAVAASGAQTTM